MYVNANYNQREVRYGIYMYMKINTNLLTVLQLSLASSAKAFFFVS